MRRQGFAEGALGIGDGLSMTGFVSAIDEKCAHPEATTDKSDQSGCEDNQRKWYAKEKEGNEGCRRQSNHDAVLEGALAHAHNGLEDDSQDRRLKPEKQRRD